MTPLSGYDAWLTSEPMFVPDLHAPFSVVELSWTDRGECARAHPEAVAVVDDRLDEDAPYIVVFRGDDALKLADRYAAVRNREAAPANEDGPGGQCTVCGDFHGEMR